MKIRYVVVIAAAVGISAAVTAEESVVAGNIERDHGIRIGIRNAPGVDELEAEFAGVTDTVPLDAQDGLQIDVMYVRRHLGKDGSNTFGPMWGAGLFLANSTGQEIGGTDEVEIGAFGIIGEGGVAAQLGQVVVLELMPFLGAGVATQDITGYSTGAGGYVLYGIKGGLFFRLGSSVELGLEAGYSGFASNGEIEEDPITYDVTYTGGGFQGAGVIVISF